MPAPSKRDKQSSKTFEYNKAERTRLKNLSKNFYRALDAGDVENAGRIKDESQVAFDKAASKGIIHPNKSARKISRFNKALARTVSEG